ncbi:conserved domain protein [Enterococcus faecium PC4.1]|nr:conserved domain protein [Enterococcus faecium PC4.1]
MKKRKKIDWWILGPYLTLSMIGLLEVYSASSYRLLQADENTKSLLLRQLIFIFLSWGVIFLARSIKLHYLLHPKIAGYGLALSIFFLILVRVGIFGVTVNGAQRWISLFGIQFQPSELANLFLIFYLSWFFRDGNNPPKNLKKPLPDYSKHNFVDFIPAKDCWSIDDSFDCVGHFLGSSSSI